MAEIQQDKLGIEARHYQAALKRVEAELRDSDEKTWADTQRLLAWDTRFTADSEAAGLFVLLRRALFHELLGDELGSDLSAYMGVALLAYNGVQEAVRSGHSSFWDDTATPQTEGPAEIWARALRRARADLAQQAGASGTLGAVRGLVFPHALARQPLIGRLFEVGPLPSGGDDYTIDVRKAQASSPQRPVFIPSYRVLFAPGDWAASRGVQPLGQSGHRFSPYRSDQLADWRAGRSHPLVWDGPPPDRTVGRLRLLPAGGPTGSQVDR
jgi:acyl-homoserine lactone acylase PvdQ